MARPLLIPPLALLLGTVGHAQTWTPTGGTPQAPPAGPVVWEAVGDRALDARSLAFDASEALWAGTSSGVWRLNSGGTWEVRLSTVVGDAVLPLGGDTILVTTGGSVRRTTDGGETWATVHDAGLDGLTEIWPGGLLVTGTISGAARSTDRGATWTNATFDTPSSTNFVTAALALDAGRVGAGGANGVTLSTDFASTFRPTALWQDLRYLIQAFASVAKPTGGFRVLAAGVDQTQPFVRIWSSDDAGVTWSTGVPLPDGAGGPEALLALGGFSALAVLGGGTVHLSEDGGSTWQLVGQTPVDSTVTRLAGATLGPDGRLYVGLVQAGPGQAWVYRTAGVVVGAEPRAAEEGAGLRLEVRPNPSTGAVVIGVTLPAASAVRAAVYDVHGRELARFIDGHVGAGRHDFTLTRSGLSSGTYVLRVETPAGTASQRFTVLG
jgi:photosystem II stability/assembly factor-like uncharacterized protein